MTEKDAAATDYKDAVSGKPLEKMKEESYFFRQSRYQERLVEHIKANPDFVRPENCRKEILTRLQKEPLLDLSISRTTFDWGIPLPSNPKHVMCARGWRGAGRSPLCCARPARAPCGARFHPLGSSDLRSHTFARNVSFRYVWFDALTNYLTGCDWPEGPMKWHWPANVHIIGASSFSSRRQLHERRLLWWFPAWRRLISVRPERAALFADHLFLQGRTSFGSTASFGHACCGRLASRFPRGSTATAS